MLGLRSNGVKIKGEEERCCEAPLDSLISGSEAEQTRDMFTVYVLRSINNPDRLYIGLTTDLKQRLIEHNSDQSTYSKRFSPWELESYIVVKNKECAESLEKYLKSGSGFAFLKKRLLPQIKN